MAEPATSAGAGLGAMAITLTGSVMGIHYDALTLAFAGGLVALFHLPSTGTVRRFVSVITSAIFGGVGAPIASAGAASSFAWVAAVGDMPVRMASAFTLGLVAQVAIPGLLAVARKKADSIDAGGPAA